MPLLPPIRLVFAEDYPQIGTLLYRQLVNEPTVTIVGQAHNAADLIILCQETSPDIVLSDLFMPGTKTTDAIHNILDRQPQIRIIVLSDEDDDVFVRSMVRLPICGYVLKGDVADCLMEAIHAVHRGAKWYSPSLRTMIADL